MGREYLLQSIKSRSMRITDGGIEAITSLVLSLNQCCPIIIYEIYFVVCPHNLLRPYFVVHDIISKS